MQPAAEHGSAQAAGRGQASFRLLMRDELDGGRSAETSKGRARSSRPGSRPTWSTWRSRRSAAASLTARCRRPTSTPERPASPTAASWTGRRARGRRAGRESVACDGRRHPWRRSRPSSSPHGPRASGRWPTASRSVRPPSRVASRRWRRSPAWPGSCWRRARPRCRAPASATSARWNPRSTPSGAPRWTCKRNAAAPRCGSSSRNPSRSRG